MMDDVYEGWDGLASAPQGLCAQVIEPMCAGTPAEYRRYDWNVGAFTTVVTVPPADIVVIEGVGSTRHRRRDAFVLTVWVQAPASVRHERACQRTGQGDFAPHARSWAEAEDGLFGVDAYPTPPTGYDLVVDTAGLAASRRG